MDTPIVLPHAKAPAVNKPFFYARPMMVHPSLPIILKEQPDAFATALAHEVRNPLTNINLALGLLEPAIKDDELIRYLDIIKRASLRINDLVNELLLFKATDEIVVKEYFIQQLLDEVLEGARDRILLKRVALSRDYAPMDCRIEMDRPKIKIALANIINNALEAMPLGKGKLKLSIHSLDRKVIVQIEDNGCGISQINLKKIFKPYFTDKPNGLGLGLSSTSDILASNHVGLRVRSKEGKGTNFILSFVCTPLLVLGIPIAHVS
jgi:signal transduction histidine kinase